MSNEGLPRAGLEEGTSQTTPPSKRRRRGPIVIAEDLADWFVYYLALIGFTFIGAITTIGAASRYPNFEVMATQLLTAYAEIFAFFAVGYLVLTLPLTLWYRENPIVQGQRIQIFTRAKSFGYPYMAVMFAIIAVLLPANLVQPAYAHPLEVAGAYLTSVLYALTAIIGPALLVYIVNPAATRFLLEYPFGYREKLRILARFPDFPVIASSRFSFLLGEVAKDTWVLMRRGFPHVDPVGVDDTFVDIQVAMRLGRQGERGTVAQFFERVEQIPYRRGAEELSYPSQVLLELNEVRTRLPEADEFRRRNGLKGLWRMGILDYLRPYEGVILVVLTIGLIVLGVYTLLTGR